MSPTISLLQDISATIKPEAQPGKCWRAVEKDMKFPKHESWPRYKVGLPMVLRRYCDVWGRGT